MHASLVGTLEYLPPSLNPTLIWWMTDKASYEARFQHRVNLSESDPRTSESFDHTCSPLPSFLPTLAFSPPQHHRILPISSCMHSHHLPSCTTFHSSKSYARTPQSQHDHLLTSPHFSPRLHRMLASSTHTHT